MNDEDRALWIGNDEGLYDWWRQHKQSKRAFIRSNRAEIDQVIENIKSGRKPAHYLKYERSRSS
jgi:hypothetical protein